jgi:hypothetical protein
VPKSIKDRAKQKEEARPVQTRPATKPASKESDLERSLAQHFKTQRKERARTEALLTDFGKQFDEILDSLLDRGKSDQVVPRMAADARALMKACILSHTGGVPLQELPVHNKKEAKTNKAQHKSTPPPQQDENTQPKAIRQAVPTRGAAQKDGVPQEQSGGGTNGGNNSGQTTPKSFAELARGMVPKDLPKKPPQPAANKTPAKTSRVFVRLPEGSALRSAHPLFIVKKVNSAFPLGKGVETASFVRTGVALMPKPGTSAADLLQDKDKISKALGDGKVEGDEKWVVVKAHDLFTRMTTIDDAH